MAVEMSARSHAAQTSDRLRIEFLFLDLTSCTRCLGADRSLGSALDIVGEVLEATGIEVAVDKILVESAEQARALRFVSSPTIRVDGRDVALELRESSCGSEACTDGCGDQIACRVWAHRGREYTEPPVAMIVDAILGHVYGDATARDRLAVESYELPENLARFFSGKAAAAEERACWPPAKQQSCCDADAKKDCCDAAPGEGCGSVGPQSRSQPLGAEAVWRDFHARLLSFIARRVRDRDSAEDILQEVMLRIHRHAGELERSPAVGAWVHQITRNAIADHYRKASGRRERPAGIDLDPRQPPVHEEAAGELRGELAACLRPLLERLPPRHREALTLTELEGLTQATAAARLGLSTSGMKSRAQRGRAQLKELLTACCEIEVDRRGGVRSYRPLGGACDCRTETPVRPER